MSTPGILSPRSAFRFVPSSVSPAANMDYSYFNSAPQPYHYFGMAQTPGPGHHLDVDNYAHGQPQAHFNSPFNAYPDSFQFDPSTYMHAPAQSQQPSRAPSRPLTHAPSISPAIPSFENVPMSGIEPSQDDQLPQRSSSEDRDNLTPQQSKRKAQNRAAQRAFRERKEKHVKDLETKVNTLQQQSMSLDSEVERLRKELARVATENEILRQTSSGQPSLGDDEDVFNPLPFASASTEQDSSKEMAAKRAQMLGSIHTIVIDDTSGEILLNSGQTWDYIQNHEAFRDGLIDVGDVIDQLKKMARCDGRGPVFRESDIRKAISECAVAGGRDEL